MIEQWLSADSVQEVPSWADQLEAWSTLGTGVITLLALIVATIGARAAFRTNAQQSKQLEILEEEAKARREQDRRMQASLISAWLDDNLRVYVTNMSSQPVYDVTLVYERIPDKVRLPFVKASLAPSVQFEVDELHVNIDSALRKSACKKLEYDFSQINFNLNSTEVQRIGDKVKSLRPDWISSGVKVEFRDASGFRWRRDSRGVLDIVADSEKDEAIRLLSHMASNGHDQRAASAWAILTAIGDLGGK